MKTPATRQADADDLDDALCEFDAVVEDFASPLEKRHFRYDDHLRTAKRRDGARDGESADWPDPNSPDPSAERLSSPASPAPCSPSPTSPKAKLGDTKELEDLIADLDKTLESM
ncbi:regulator of cell cycle RGCC [Syngnathoides biaculeatus]|uniref:regulator of cell cycle RGCC n=1 Tax=Syngnathoides biaculeatus TaxID=300417 RepID=UPI002ADE1715|nr:regulator of cell cycle RGCC [Syngnathoides biaculeatus]